MLSSDLCTSTTPRPTCTLCIYSTSQEPGSGGARRSQAQIGCQDRSCVLDDNRFFCIGLSAEIELEDNQFSLFTQRTCENPGPVLEADLGQKTPDLPEQASPASTTPPLAQCKPRCKPPFSPRRASPSSARPRTRARWALHIFLAYSGSNTDMAHKSKWGTKVLQWYMARDMPVTPVHPVRPPRPMLQTMLTRTFMLQKEAELEGLKTARELGELSEPTQTSVSVITPPAVRPSPAVVRHPYLSYTTVSRTGHARCPQGGKGTRCAGALAAAGRRGRRGDRLRSGERDGGQGDLRRAMHPCARRRDSTEAVSWRGRGFGAVYRRRSLYDAE
jgi:hypothetical protein